MAEEQARKSTKSKKSDSKVVEAKEEVVAAASAPTRAPMWKKVLFGFIGFFVAIALFAFVFTRDAQSAADAFIKDLQATNCQEIFDRTSSDFRLATPQEAWLAACERISPILSGDTDAAGIEVNKDGDVETAEAGFTIEGTDDNTYRIDLVMTKTDGEWLLDGLNSQNTGPTDSTNDETDMDTPDSDTDTEENTEDNSETTEEES